MRQRLFYFLWFIGGLQTQLAAQPTSVITNRSSNLEIVSDAAFFVDSTGRKTITALRQQPDLFTPARNELDFGRTDATNWVRFSVRNTAAVPLRFMVYSYYPRLERIEGFLLKPNGQVVAFPAAGWGVPLALRPFPAPKNVFPLAIDPHSQLTIFLAVSARYQRVIVPISLYPYNQMLTKIQLNTLSDGIVSCVLLFVFIISLIYFIDSEYKEWGNLWYSLYALSSFLFYFIRFDLPYLNQKPLDPRLNYGVDVFSTSLLLFYCLSGYNFMSGVAVSRWFSRFYWRTMVILAITAIGLLAVPTHQMIQTALVVRILLAAVGIGGLLYTLAKGIMSRNQYALLFLFMFLPLLFFYVAQVLATDLGQNEYITDVILTTKLVVFFETTLMMIGFIYKNNRLRHQMKQRLAQQEKLVLVTQIQTQEAERRRLAADLHDDLGGTLATLRRRLGDLRQRLRDPQAADALGQLEPLVQKSTQDLRRIAHNLMPPEFDRLGLRHALDQLVESQPAQPAHFSFVTAGQERRLPLEIELNLYRIVSELVQNIHKHAEARRAAVQLLYYEDHLSVMVEDDGLGSQVKKNSGTGTGLGLKNSSLRAEYIGARLRRDVTGAGTLVVLDVPYATTFHGAFPPSPPTPD